MNWTYAFMGEPGLTKERIDLLPECTLTRREKCIVSQSKNKWKEQSLDIDVNASQCLPGLSVVTTQGYKNVKWDPLLSQAWPDLRTLDVVSKLAEYFKAKRKWQEAGENYTEGPHNSYHLARLRVSNAYRVSIENPEGKRPFRRPRNIWEVKLL